LLKKGNTKDFVFFKYLSNDENEKEKFESEEQVSSSSSEKLESKDIMLKEIELMFEN
jgi:hypothetical protein